MLEFHYNDITITQYNTAEIAVTPYYDTGDTYILDDGEKVVFTVRSPVTGEVVLKKTLTASDYNENGELVIYLTSDDTALVCEQYVYDVALITDVDFVTFIPKSKFRVVQAITKGGGSSG